MWCIGPEQDAAFVAHMEDVLEVYQRPYDPENPMVCMDEVSKQLISEKRGPLPPEPGRPERCDGEYVREGTANLFMTCEPLAGKRRVKVTDTRKREDWAAFVKELVDEQYPEAEKVVLVMDQLNTHSTVSLYETFAPAEARRLAQKLEIHHTPRHGSWLNMAEIELSALSRQCLDRRIADKATLERETAAWQARRNAAGTKINWRLTTPDARIKLKRLYPIQNCRNTRHVKAKRSGR